jgi:tetratricopeptide (TPR) repeat protein
VDGVPVLDTTSIGELQAAVSAAGRPLVLTFRTPLIRGTNPDTLARHAEWLRREYRFWSAAAAYSMALAAGHAVPGWCLNQHGMCLGMAGTTLHNSKTGPVVLIFPCLMTCWTQPVTVLLVCAGFLTDALLSFDKAIDCDPGPRSASRLYNRAYLLRRMGRLQDAAAGFVAAMDLDDNEAPRCTSAIADIEAQVQERAAASAERHAPLSTESPLPVAEPAIQAEVLYLCSCDQLKPKWRECPVQHT